MDVKIKFEKSEIEAEIFQTEFGKKIIEALPFTTKAKLWGKEIYFEIPVKSSIQNPKNEVEKGDIGYWPDGNCMCLFFGPTPISKGDKIIPASAIEIIGKIKSDLKILESIKSGEKIIVEKK
ncbi:MAG: cyclophilin-like fold protein [bacterium]|nr:cyclophilin-like fold protein [bacterium]MDW8163736.1 cyclophilin-like fold protein [Candidatus Omnitrophota bacterium]